MQSGEKKTLYEMILDSIDRDIERGSLSSDERGAKFKSFIRKDEQDCFCLVDDTAIKCVFDEKNMRDYMDSLPSYVSMEGMLY